MKPPERPKIGQTKLMDGFYIEVSNRGSKSEGVKIRSESKNAMEESAKEYAKFKTVTILGEYKDEMWLI